MPLRIAMFSWESLHSVSVGGLAAHVTELSEGLRMAGHSVHVFTRPAEGRDLYDCIEGVHYHRCPFDSSPDLFTYIDRMGNSFVDRMLEAEQFYGRPFDIVHGHDWMSAQAFARVKNNLHRPVVLTMHSTEFGRCGNALYEGRSRRVRDIEWGGTFVADQVISVSKALQEEMHWLYGIPHEKMTTLYNGVDCRRFDLDVDNEMVRARHGIGAQDPCVLFLGRLTWQKGPDLLLECIPNVLHHYPEAKCVFVGDGDLRNSLQGRAAALGLFQSVRFVGCKQGNDVVSLLKSADTVCVPSRNEPFGIVVLEAWSASRPVVVTRNGGPGEFVRDQDTGFVVDSDCDSIGWGIGTALGDSSRARQIGQNGRWEAESHFSWNTISRKTADVYESVLAA